MAPAGHLLFCHTLSSLIYRKNHENDVETFRLKITSSHYRFHQKRKIVKLFWPPLEALPENQGQGDSLDPNYPQEVGPCLLNCHLALGARAPWAKLLGGFFFFFFFFFLFFSFLFFSFLFFSFLFFSFLFFSSLFLLLCFLFELHLLRFDLGCSLVKMFSQNTTAKKKEKH